MIPENPSTLLAAVSKDSFVSWEMKQLYLAAKKLGYSWSVIDPRYTTFDVAHEAMVSRTIKPCRPGAILGRVDMDCLVEGTRLLDMLKQTGLPVINDADAFWIGRDKCKTALALKHAEVPHPRTWLLAHSHLGTLAKKLHFPVVAKPIIGSGGAGVTLLHSRTQLSLLSKDRFPLLIQEYVGPIQQDIRVLVLAGKSLGAVRRIPKPGEWRGNAQLGAAAEAIPMSKELDFLAVKAVQAVGADFAAVDLIQSDRGTFVIEVNICPGFKAFSLATEIDVAKQVVLTLVSLSTQDCSHMNRSKNPTGVTRSESARSR